MHNIMDNNGKHDRAKTCHLHVMLQKLFVLFVSIGCILVAIRKVNVLTLKLYLETCMVSHSTGKRNKDVS